MLHFLSFQYTSTCRSEDKNRQGKGDNRGTTMADTTMVYSPDEDSCGLSGNIAQHKKVVETSTLRHATSTGPENGDDCMQSVRRQYRQQGLSRQATDVLMSSWRKSTKRQYQVHIKKWLQYSGIQEINQISVSVNNVIEFLTDEFQKGLGYNSINTARSALSSLGIKIDGYLAGSHPSHSIYERCLQHEAFTTKI